MSSLRQLPIIIKILVRLLSKAVLGFTAAHLSRSSYFSSFVQRHIIEGLIFVAIPLLIRLDSLPQALKGEFATLSDYQGQAQHDLRAIWWNASGRTSSKRLLALFTLLDQLPGTFEDKLLRIQKLREPFEHLLFSLDPQASFESNNADVLDKFIDCAFKSALIFNDESLIQAITQNSFFSEDCRKTALFELALFNHFPLISLLLQDQSSEFIQSWSHELLESYSIEPHCQNQWADFLYDHGVNFSALAFNHLHPDQIHRLRLQRMQAYIRERESQEFQVLAQNQNPLKDTVRPRTRL